MLMPTDFVRGEANMQEGTAAQNDKIQPCMMHFRFRRITPACQ